MQFLGDVGRQNHVAWTMLFLDEHVVPSPAARTGRGGKKGNEARSSSGKFALPDKKAGFRVSDAFATTSKKYCTEKGESYCSLLVLLIAIILIDNCAVPFLTTIILQCIYHNRSSV